MLEPRYVPYTTAAVLAFVLLGSGLFLLLRYFPAGGSRLDFRGSIAAIGAGLGDARARVIEIVPIPIPAEPQQSRTHPGVIRLRQRRGRDTAIVPGDSATTDRGVEQGETMVRHVDNLAGAAARRRVALGLLSLLDLSARLWRLRPAPGCGGRRAGGSGGAWWWCSSPWSSPGSSPRPATRRGRPGRGPAARCAGVWLTVAAWAVPGSRRGRSVWVQSRGVSLPGDRA